MSLTVFLSCLLGVMCREVDVDVKLMLSAEC